MTVTDTPRIRIRALTDLSHPDLQALVDEHLTDMYATSPPESVHALGLAALDHPAITVWAAYDDGELLGCAALKELDPDTGEVKSMRTARAARGRGVGTALLHGVITEARARSYRVLLLETGSQDFFAPARRLYVRHGFVECGPFGSYGPDPHSIFMSLTLANP